MSIHDHAHLPMQVALGAPGAAQLVFTKFVSSAAEVLSFRWYACTPLAFSDGPYSRAGAAAAAAAAAAACSATCAPKCGADACSAQCCTPRCIPACMIDCYTACSTCQQQCTQVGEPSGLCCLLLRMLLYSLSAFPHSLATYFAGWFFCLTIDALIRSGQGREAPL
jgi:hypothetical protein